MKFTVEWFRNIGIEPFGKHDANLNAYDITHDDIKRKIVAALLTANSQDAELCADWIIAAFLPTVIIQHDDHVEARSLLSALEIPLAEFIAARRKCQQK